MSPVEPPASALSFTSDPDERGIVRIGGDMEPGTVLAAYRAGAFPMRNREGKLAWWSPDPRAVLWPARVRVSKSLRRSLRRFTTTLDTAFESVVDECAERGDDEYQWIDDDVREAYCALHVLGWAHSVETWSIPTENEPAQLVGGLYGVAVGGLFSGESMFSRRPDASKVALLALIEVLRADKDEGRLVDVQWLTPHLASLGALEISRREYLARLERAARLTLPKPFAAQPGP